MTHVKPNFTFTELVSEFSAQTTEEARTFFCLFASQMDINCQLISYNFHKSFEF